MLIHFQASLKSKVHLIHVYYVRCFAPPASCSLNNPCLPYRAIYQYTYQTIKYINNVELGQINCI